MYLSTSDTYVFHPFDVLEAGKVRDISNLTCIGSCTTKSCRVDFVNDDLGWPNGILQGLDDKDTLRDVPSVNIYCNASRNQMIEEIQVTINIYPRKYYHTSTGFDDMLTELVPHNSPILLQSTVLGNEINATDPEHDKDLIPGYEGSRIIISSLLLGKEVSFTISKLNNLETSQLLVVGNKYGIVYHRRKSDNQFTDSILRFYSEYSEESETVYGDVFIQSGFLLKRDESIMQQVLTVEEDDSYVLIISALTDFETTLIRLINTDNPEEEYEETIALALFNCAMTRIYDKNENTLALMCLTLDRQQIAAYWLMYSPLRLQKFDGYTDKRREYCFNVGDLVSQLPCEEYPSWIRGVTHYTNRQLKCEEKDKWYIEKLSITYFSSRIYPVATLKREGDPKTYMFGLHSTEYKIAWTMKPTFLFATTKELYFAGYVRGLLIGYVENRGLEYLLSSDHAKIKLYDSPDIYSRPFKIECITRMFVCTSFSRVQDGTNRTRVVVYRINKRRESYGRVFFNQTGWENAVDAQLSVADFLNNTIRITILINPNSSIMEDSSKQLNSANIKTMIVDLKYPQIYYYLTPEMDIKYRKSLITGKVKESGKKKWIMREIRFGHGNYIEVMPGAPVRHKLSLTAKGNLNHSNIFDGNKVYLDSLFNVTGNVYSYSLHESSTDSTTKVISTVQFVISYSWSMEDKCAFVQRLETDLYICKVAPQSLHFYYKNKRIYEIDLLKFSYLTDFVDLSWTLELVQGFTTQNHLFLMVVVISKNIQSSTSDLEFFNIMKFKIAREISEASGEVEVKIEAEIDDSGITKVFHLSATSLSDWYISDSHRKQQLIVLPQEDEERVKIILATRYFYTLSVWVADISCTVLNEYHSNCTVIASSKTIMNKNSASENRKINSFAMVYGNSTVLITLDMEDYYSYHHVLRLKEPLVKGRTYNLFDYFESIQDIFGLKGGTSLYGQLLGPDEMNCYGTKELTDTVSIFAVNLIIFGYDGIFYKESLCLNEKIRLSSPVDLKFKAIRIRHVAANDIKSLEPGQLIDICNTGKYYIVKKERVEDSSRSDILIYQQNSPWQQHAMTSGYESQSIMGCFEDDDENGLFVYDSAMKELTEYRLTEPYLEIGEKGLNGQFTSIVVNGFQLTNEKSICIIEPSSNLVIYNDLNLLDTKVITLPVSSFDYIRGDSSSQVEQLGYFRLIGILATAAIITLLGCVLLCSPLKHRLDMKDL